MTSDLEETWSGSWVADRFGVQVTDAAGEPLRDLVGVALRRNPRRAHLLVSTVLGKHRPTDPRVVHGAGLRLGAAVARVLRADGPVVVGTAETATGLGHCVAEALGADYLHSTRRPAIDLVAAGGFEEEHSHATSHLLLPEDPDVLRRPGPVVLVDDELSTGRTALNTIAALHRLRPREQFVVATLTDLRGPADRAYLAERAATLGTSIEVVALATGHVSAPADLIAQAAALAESSPVQVHDRLVDSPGRPPIRVPVSWPDGVPDGGRHGMDERQRAQLQDAVAEIGARIGPQVQGHRLLVLGFEELMYAPLLLAVALTAQAEVRCSTTTRTPVVVVDEPGYPIRNVLAFPSHDDPADGPGERYAYNVVGAVAGGQPYDDIVLVIDDVADTATLHAPGGLVDQLRGVTQQVHLVVVPSYHPLPEPLRGPAFGSYAPADVAWLLTDLSAVALEAPVEEREEAIQSGGAHYAESLPIEYQPTADYQAQFAAALLLNSTRTAHAVGVVTELVLAARGPSAVLVSLARAGTPVGILMRRWAAFAHGLDLPHYAASIVRGQGFDPVAARFLAERHDPASVMFVDGWTGKGAIVRELAAAIDSGGWGVSAELAVLADPGSCVSIFGTRDDLLVPSACLNSTVSGLVSRTVRNPAVLRPGQFDGAKYYAELAGADVSAVFLDAITARFQDVAEAVAHDWPVRRDSERGPTWAGWAAVEQISTAYDINDVNLVKPGVGETTRVLLRRVPWRVLVRRGATDEVAHVLLLAEQRGVPVETVDELPYNCVGLIHPAYTRGASGPDGRRVP